MEKGERSSHAWGRNSNKGERKNSIKREEILPSNSNWSFNANRLQQASLKHYKHDPPVNSPQKKKNYKHPSHTSAILIDPSMYIQKSCKTLQTGRL